MKKKKEMFVDDISYNGAANLLDAMKNSSLKDFFSIFTGGTFNATKIKRWKRSGNNGSPFSGLMFWFCLAKKENSPILKFYLAIEPKFGFNYDQEVNSNPDFKSWRPKNNDLVIIPGHSFGENIYSLPRNEIFEKLKGHKFDKLPVDLPPFRDINHDIQSFLDESYLNQMNQSPFAYFNVNGVGRDSGIDFFNLLLGQARNVTHLRYYFGFDPQKAPYCTRLILTPVNKNGRNIVINNNNNLEDSTTLLQYSWPPKPTGTDE